MCVIPRLGAQDESHVQLLQQLDVRAVGRQPILHHRQLQMRMLPAHVLEQAFHRVALAVVLPRPVALHNRLRRQRKHLALPRMHQHRAQQLMVIRDPTVAVALAAAMIAMHLRGGEIPRAVHAQQVVSAQAGETLQTSAPLQRRQHALERPPQAVRVHLVQSLPQRRVRRRPAHCVQTLQVRANQRLAPSGHGVLDAVKAGAHLPEQARGAQGLAKARAGRLG